MAEQEHWVVKQMVEHRVVRFLRGVHKYLGRQCFLRGAFVFEDPYGEVLQYLLMDDNHLARGVWQAWWKTTHMKVASNRKVDASLDIDKREWVPNINRKLVQYERRLSPKAAYLCNCECIKEWRPHCKDRKDAKGVILVYHFKTDDDNSTFPEGVANPVFLYLRYSGVCISI